MLPTVWLRSRVGSIDIFHPMYIATQKNMQQLNDALRSRVLVLDGSLGVSFQNLHLSEEQMRGSLFADHPCALTGNFDILNLSAPAVVESVHRSFLEAGADIIETNTFNSQTLSQSEYSTAHLVAHLNEAGARIARRVADEFTTLNPAKPRFVAGSIGPTAYTLSMMANVADSSAHPVDFVAVSDAVALQAEHLIRGGVDVLLVETVFDALNVKAAYEGIRRARFVARRDVPVIFSVTLSDASRRLLTGQKPEAFLASLAYAQPLAVGFNCSGGPESLVDSIRSLSEVSPFYTILYPNAGMPDALGQYSLSPESFAEALKPLLADGCLNIVGGCCGTMPAHISAVARIAAGATPRRPGKGHLAWLAGLEPFEHRQGVFINVGERCNVAGSRRFLRLVKEKAYDEAVAVAVGQVRDGAMILDINLDDAMLDIPAEMTHFLRLLSADAEAAAVPWMIDSSSFDVIEAALQCIGGKAIVNSISLKHGPDEFLRQAEIIRRYGAAVVVMLFDEDGQATDFDHKIRVARRSYDLLTTHGWNAADIIIDPNILTVATGMEAHADYARHYIDAVRWIKANLPGALTSGGVSNLSFAFRGNNYVRQAMHAVFLYHAVAAGLDMAIIDPTSRVLYDDVEPELLVAIENVLFNRSPEATDRLTEVAARYAGAKPGSIDDAAAPRGSLTVEERLKDALLRGDHLNMEADISEAMALYGNPSHIIEQILMAGMDRVGTLFGEGRLFLPQVVKSARCMRVAVDFLRPYMERSAVEAPFKGKIVIATVKGDVHDIGKNIAAVVMRCNNFEVIDLGVQVDADTLLAAVREHHPDFVGLSGLITPSLQEMAKILRSLRRGGVSVPVLVGGAATSRLHTALRLAPEYPGGVVAHVADAAQNVVVASRLLSHYADTAADIRSGYEALVAEHIRVQAGAIADYEAHRPDFDWVHETIVKPSYIGCRTLPETPVADVRPYINWRYFCHTWHVTPDTPEAAGIIAEAEDMLDSLSALTMRASVAFYEARPHGDSIRAGGYTIPTPRQKPRPDRDVCLSLADFISPVATDYIGMFCVTIGDALRSLLAHPADDYQHLLLQSVCDRLAEATSEYLHRQVRTRLWGYSPDESLDLDAIRRGKYCGIRPAVGYGCLPDQSVMHTVADMVGMDEIGVEVTENGALAPSSSVAGLYIASRHARYFTV